MFSRANVSRPARVQDNRRYGKDLIIYPEPR